MRIGVIGMFLCSLIGVCKAQQASVLENQIQKISIQTDDSLVYGTSSTSILPTVQVAHWKDGYIVCYVTSSWRSKYFFTNHLFEKISQEYEVKNRIVYQVVTDNNEIAFLAGNKSGSLSSLRSDHAYFIKVQENGTVEQEKLIIGAEKVKKGNATELDDWGNYLMRWTGTMYVTFFPIQHNFRKVGPPDVHQGDCVYFIQSNGNVLAYNDWGASHSFEQRMVVGDKFIATAAKGDAYPRGLDVNYIDLKQYEVLAFDKGEKDMNNASISHYYEPEREPGCTAFKVSGTSGANYVPFSLGDILLLNSSSAMISFSSKDKKATHDIGIVRTSPSFTNCQHGFKYITNTPTIAEHSVRMALIAENRVLIYWKEFDVKASTSKIKKLDREIGCCNAEETIFTAHNMDVNKMAVIDSTGKFIIKPQKIAGADWYYTQGLMESSSAWYNIIEGFTNYSYSPIFETKKGKTAWAHHQHKAKAIDVFTFSVPTSILEPSR